MIHLDLDGRYEGVLLKDGNNSVIIHFSSLPWSFRSFDIAELAGAFLLFRNVIDDLATLKVFPHFFSARKCHSSLFTDKINTWI